MTVQPVVAGGCAPERAPEVRAVCHDLRQPIATIMILADSAGMVAGLPDDVRDALRSIVDQAGWMSAMVRDALGGLPVAAALVDVAAVVDDVVATCRLSQDTTVRRIGDGPAFVTAERSLLRRAVANLVDNAARAAGPSGTVQVRTSTSAMGVILDVDDDGPGFGAIPAGHGIGLTVAREAAASTGGRLEHAAGPLGGVRARLVLPPASAASIVAAVTPSGRAAG